MGRAKQAPDLQVDAFISRWSVAPLGERAKYQSFINQLCEIIGVAAPDQERVDDLGYSYERRISFQHDDGASTPGWIDLYKAGSFVLEAKQSRKRQSQLQTPQLELTLAGGQRRGPTLASKQGWDPILRRAKRQAEDYAKALDEWPPFIVVVDVGRVIEVFADFSRQGKNYVPFPDRTRFRIHLDDLRSEAVRERLRLVWLDPQALDPSAQAAVVTQDIAQLLARLTRSLERRISGGWEAATAKERAVQAEAVASFLTQCIFAMFAEDVGLLKGRAFQKLIEAHRGNAAYFHIAAKNFFEAMDEGGYSLAAQEKLRYFNGGVFRNKPVIEVDEDDLDLLSKAAARDWRDVEPAIFGALLEHALDAVERGQLGAHYTPRAYVERLVTPTIIEPLREDWDLVEAAAAARWREGRTAEAIALVRRFHQSLCDLRVLDPACGTGNFLYVALKLIKELEGDVLTLLKEMGGEPADRGTVTPAQFHGIEKDPHAARIAELVLWIGYLQWHLKTFGPDALGEPILQDTRTIDTRDALLQFDAQEALIAPDGSPLIGRHDSHAARRLHPITGALVPDPSKRLQRAAYLNPRPAAWPQADFIVGNPPFIAGKDVRAELGDDYAEALWASRKRAFNSADLVTYWWDQAAGILTQPETRLRRFGFISTSSITQTFSRRVIERHLKANLPVRLVYAIADHPWVKGPKKAAVRIAMTVAEAGPSDEHLGRLAHVIHEDQLETDAPVVELSERGGAIAADLSLGVDVTDTSSLAANADLCSPGMKLHGAGFLVTPAEARDLGLGRLPGLDGHIRPYVNGRDLAGRSRGLFAIDLYGLAQDSVRRRYPAVYQHLLARVKPERDVNNRPTYRDHWWIFGEPRAELRPALDGLRRYIVTVETARYRWFTFLDATVLPDNKLIVVASDDPFYLGVLSSRIHVIWSDAAGGRLGVGNDPVYAKTVVFDPFPFPHSDASTRSHVAELALEIDDHRRSVLAAHPRLTMTGLYEVREKLRRSQLLSDADRTVYELGLVGALHELHEQLDAAVAQAYGWAAGLDEQSILSKLVELNHERSEREDQGDVAWLRPAFQAERVVGRLARKRRIVTATSNAEPPLLPPTDQELARAVLSLLRRRRRTVAADELAGTFADGRTPSSMARVMRVLGELEHQGAISRDEALNGWFAPLKVA